MAASKIKKKRKTRQVKDKSSIAYNQVSTQNAVSVYEQTLEVKKPIHLQNNKQFTYKRKNRSTATNGFVETPSGFRTSN